jgi:endopeptidase La
MQCVLDNLVNNNQCFKENSSSDSLINSNDEDFDNDDQGIRLAVETVGRARKPVTNIKKTIDRVPKKNTGSRKPNVKTAPKKTNASVENISTQSTESSLQDDNEIINTFLIYQLNKEYSRYSNIILKLENHIDTLHSLHIIDYSSRNCYLKILNNIIKLLNLTYNDNLRELDDNIKLLNKSTLPFNNYFTNHILTQYKLLGDNIYDYAYDLYSNYRVATAAGSNYNSNDNALLQDNLNKLDKFHNVMDVILKDVCAKVGFNSIKFACTLLGLTKEYNPELFTLYNKIFVPLNYSIVKQSEIGFINSETGFDINLTSSSLKYDMLNEYGRLYLKHGVQDTYYVLDGYFKIDCLGTVRKTCQINYPTLFDKIVTIEMQLKSNLIPETFYKNYIKNNTVACILINDINTVCDRIIDQYNTYNTIHNMTLTELINYIESIDESNIDKFYETVKLILLKAQILSCEAQDELQKSESDNSTKDNNITIPQSKITLTEFIAPMFEAMKMNTSFHDKELLEVLYKYFSFEHQLKLKSLINKDTYNGNLTSSNNSNSNNNENDTKKKIKDHKYMPEKVKKCAIEKLKEMKSGNGNEYYKQSMYIKTLLNFPWPTPHDDQIFTNLKTNNTIKEYLNSVMINLDEIIYGHLESKKSIVELIGKWISNPNSSGYSFGLCGPPGIGKTLFAKAIGKAMGIPFVQITLGGQNDGELLHGHGYTYSGSQPGMIIKKMIEAGNSRCIMYFDELDKACKKHDSNEIFNILVHLTDPNTNTQFQDRFFQEINFPLNKVLFIFSYNDDRLIDNILMDRIKKLEIKPFKIHDKREIIKKFILPEMCESINIETDSIMIDDNNINYIIEAYTNEPGVRDLKRAFERIFLKLNIDKIYSTNVFSDTTNNSIVLSNKVIKEYLGEPHNDVEIIHDDDLIGVINGLYATDSGRGGILPIEVYYNKIGAEVTTNLTGSQKRVMRESVKTAYTVATNIVKSDKLEIHNKINPYGLHIHTPSCAVPKDGPSAGAAFTIAIVSRILSKKIRRDVAITGEINLRGNITKIGALVYKLNGAKKAGVKLVLVSEENKEDLNTILKDDSTLCNDDFKVILVSNIIDAFKYTIIDFDLADYA